MSSLSYQVEATAIVGFGVEILVRYRDVGMAQGVAHDGDGCTAVQRVAGVGMPQPVSADLRLADGLGRLLDNTGHVGLVHGLASARPCEDGGRRRSLSPASSPAGPGRLVRAKQQQFPAQRENAKIFVNK